MYFNLTPDVLKGIVAGGICLVLLIAGFKLTSGKKGGGSDKSSGSSTTTTSSEESKK